MRWLTAALATIVVFSAGSACADDIICRGFERQWQAVAGGSDIAAMDRVIAGINPVCKTLLSNAKARRDAVRSQKRLAETARSVLMLAPQPLAPPPRPMVVTDPDWVLPPSADLLARLYPDRAARLGVSGQVVLECSVASSGQVEDCKVVSEDPPNFDFGAAALQAAPSFVMRPQQRDGKPVAGGKVRIPISFAVPPPGSSASTAGATPRPRPPPLETKEFIIYFPADQYVLTPNAQAVVQMAAQYAEQGSTQVVVVGHTDTSGSVPDDMQLSERRAKAAADELVADGVSQKFLDVSWKGHSDPALQTGAGVREPLNNRAEIVIQYPGP